MYKKIITTFVAVVLIGGPLSLATARAQTVDTQTTINTAQLQQLLSLLVSELALLEQEYNQLVAEQASSTQALTQTQGEIGTATSTTSSTVEATTSPTLNQIETVAPQVVQTQPISTTTIVESSTATVSAPIIEQVGLSNGEQSFLHSYQGFRTDDLINCPIITNATTAQNIANIDNYIELQRIGSEPQSGLVPEIVTINGNLAIMVVQSIGGIPTDIYYTNPGDTVTITGNLSYQYCADNAALVSQGLPSMTSTSTYTFTSNSTLLSVLGFYILPCPFKNPDGSSSCINPQ